MKRALPLVVLLSSVAACSGSPQKGDGHTLWLAPNGSELVLKLQPVEPEPY